MKVFSAIVKICVAMAAVAGAAYLLATYGDKLVAWAKSLVSGHCCCCCQEDPAQEPGDAPAEEPVDAPAQEPAEEAPVIPAEDPVADDQDFAE